jgi:cytochrome c556
MPRLRAIFAGLTLAIVLPTIAWTQQPARPIPPRLDPVAETKLLMEGLAQPNFRSVDKLLKDEPAEAEAWQFARGQSLLIAETGNLLMLRPPKSASAEDAWMKRATDLREKATSLARATAAKDPVKGRAALLAVAVSCNRCHETFRVDVKITTSDREK